MPLIFKQTEAAKQQIKMESTVLNLSVRTTSMDGANAPAPNKRQQAKLSMLDEWQNEILTTC